GGVCGQAASDQETIKRTGYRGQRPWAPRGGQSRRCPAPQCVPAATRGLAGCGEEKHGGNPSTSCAREAATASGHAQGGGAGSGRRRRRELVRLRGGAVGRGAPSEGTVSPMVRRRRTPGTAEVGDGRTLPKRKHMPHITVGKSYIVYEAHTMPLHAG